MTLTLTPPLSTSDYQDECQAMVHRKIYGNAAQMECAGQPVGILLKLRQNTNGFKKLRSIIRAILPQEQSSHQPSQVYCSGRNAKLLIFTVSFTLVQ